MKMFGGVLIRRAVATADVTAGFAQSQVHPCVAHLQAIFTPFGPGRDCPYLIEVGTLLNHRLSLLKQDTAKRVAKTTATKTDELLRKGGCSDKLDVDVSCILPEWRSSR